MSALVVVDAEVDGRPGTSVRTEGGRVVAVGPDGEVDRRRADVLDARGGALLPGLHDHHLHLLALAARLAAVDLAPAPTPAAADALLASAPTDASGWVRAGGYDEHRHGPLDRQRLDRLRPGTAVRVQHRTGLSWALSTEALERVRLRVGPGPRPAPGDPPADGGGAGEVVAREADGTATGWLHRADRWLGRAVGRTPPALAPVGAALAAVGVTGATDTTPELDDGAVGLLRAARADGTLAQHVMVLGREGDDGLGAEEGDGLVLGPRKLVLDEHAGLDLEAVARRVAEVHAGGRAVALHCVTRAECVVAVAALAAAGPLGGDRLEHATVLPPELDGALAAGGTTVVAQPSLLFERGDHHLAEVEVVDHPLLHRLASLDRAGVALGLSTDAPVTRADPWAAVEAASRRRTRDGVVLGAAEALSAGRALAGFLTHPSAPGGPARRVVVGAPADLCLLHEPLEAALRRPCAASVRATVVDGRVIHLDEADR